MLARSDAAAGHWKKSFDHFPPRAVVRTATLPSP